MRPHLEIGQGLSEAGAHIADEVVVDKHSPQSLQQREVAERRDLVVCKQERALA